MLKKVARGETIQITLRGVLIVKLVPADSGQLPDRQDILCDIRELRKRVTLGKIRSRRLIEEGRLISELALDAPAAVVWCFDDETTPLTAN